MSDRHALGIEHESELVRLYNAVEAGDLDVVRTIAAAQPALLRLAYFGNAGSKSVLHMAAASGQEAVCHWLLGWGLPVDVSFSGNDGTTPLMAAVNGGHAAVCTLLLQAGANPDGTALVSCPPLYAAAVAGRGDIVELLLHAGADVNRLHRQMNQSSLDVARIWKHPAVAATLEYQGGRSVRDYEGPYVQGPGESIIVFVHNTAGPVLRPEFSPVSRDPRASLHVSLIDGKSDFKLLFTTGLHGAGTPMTELFLCLQGNWPLPRTGLADDSVWRFPELLLSRMVEKLFAQGPISEGHLVERSDPAFTDLPWPEDVDALLAVDKPWNPVNERDSIPPHQRVTLLVLAPVKYTRKGRPDAGALATLLERKRKASWRVLSLRRDDPRVRLAVLPD